jgi:hypothetical protein
MVVFEVSRNGMFHSSLVASIVENSIAFCNEYAKVEALRCRILDRLFAHHYTVNNIQGCVYPGDSICHISPCSK